MQLQKCVFPRFLATWGFLHTKFHATVGILLKGLLEGEFSDVVLLLSPELFRFDRISIWRADNRGVSSIAVLLTLECKI